jgi:GNAT superfamily N-acetyltransferase
MTDLLVTDVLMVGEGCALTPRRARPADAVGARRSGGTIRKLRLNVAQLYRDHLLRLDAESRRDRFCGAVSDEFIRSYSEPGKLVGAVIHGFFVEGVLRGVAEMRPLPGGHQAEVAFSIEKPWQSRGIGTDLLERTLLAARNRGIKLLHMSCIAENRRVQQLALKFHAELKFERGMVAGDVAAPHPTAMSLLREVLADGTGFVTAILDVQSRLLDKISGTAVDAHGCIMVTDRKGSTEYKVVAR